MFTVTLDPIIFQFGHLALRWYSLILLTATAVGVWLTAKEASPGSVIWSQGANAWQE